MTIEAAQEKDIPILAGYIGQLFELEPDFQPNREKQERGLFLLLNNPLGCIMTLKREGHPVGLATGQMVASTAEGRYSLWVEDVFIIKEYRGMGWGTKLLGALKAWAQEKGASRVQLLADRENLAALDFYKKTGWTTTRLVAMKEVFS